MREAATPKWREGGAMPVVLITGSQGRIGRVLSQGLQEAGMELRLFDRKRGEPDEVVVGDLSDLALLESVMQGVDFVVHLAGIPEEAPFEDLLENNVRGTYHVFEAARRTGVRRVVFASTNHVIGFHDAAEVIDETAEPRPDTVYGLTKVFGEAMGRLYHDKYGIEAVAIRIGSFRERPGSHRELSTWLSHDDAVRLFVSCIEATEVGYLVVYGVSANSRSRWRDRAGDRIGYRPVDDAEAFVDDVTPPGPADRFHGGSYTDPGHVGGF
jgi:uronate dehydrogenase